MVNYWLVRISKKRAVKEINHILATFCGHPSKHLDATIQKLRGAVLEYFKKNPQYLKHFLRDGSRLDYRFHIEEKGGVLVKITFEEK
jgi:hypothetical protein